MNLYKNALKEEMIVKLRKHVKEWREGAISGDEAMYDLEIWVGEIWGENWDVE